MSKLSLTQSPGGWRMTLICRRSGLFTADGNVWHEAPLHLFVTLYVISHTEGKKLLFFSFSTSGRLIFWSGQEIFISDYDATCENVLIWINGVCNDGDCISVFRGKGSMQHITEQTTVKHCIMWTCSTTNTTCTFPHTFCVYSINTVSL